MCAMKDKYSKSQKKFVKSVQFTNLSKREFVKRFLKDTASLVWPREMSIVKKLWSIFPDEGFWSQLNLSFKLNSLCWFLSDDGRNFLNIEYKKFKLELPEVSEFSIEENNIAFDSKVEYDKGVLNLRDFLNLWQKKKIS